MKKYKRAALSIAFLTFVLSGGLTSGYINSNQNTNNKSASKQEEMILNSFENDDYDAWKKFIPKKSRIQEVITKDDFERFVSARDLARSGEYDQAIRLSEGLESKVKEKLIIELS